MKIGVDIGNYNTNTSNSIIFESRISKRNYELSDYSEVHFREEKYFIGQGSFDSEYRKIKKPTYLKLLYAALSRSLESGDVELGLGLPLSQYKQDRNELVRLIENNCFMTGEKDFYITKVEVFPEGAVSVPIDFEGVVVDIGGRTTDVCLIENINGTRKILNPNSFGSGMIPLEQEFINQLNAKFGLDLAINDFKRILNKGLDIYGQRQDITFAISIFKEYLENLLSDINSEYNLKIHKIAFTGGGSINLAKPILKRLPNAKIVNDPLFGNAKAYENLLRGV